MFIEERKESCLTFIEVRKESCLMFNEERKESCPMFITELYPYYLVLVGPGNGLEHDFTIELK